MKCRDLSGFLETCLDAYVDGELEARECGELESHLAECDSCRSAVRSQARLKSLLRERAGGVRAPGHLVTRLCACLDEEAGHEDDMDEALVWDGAMGTMPGRGLDEAARQTGPHSPSSAFHGAARRMPTLPSWKTMPVFASVAMLAVFVWMSGSAASHEPIVDDAVRKHARRLPLEVTGPAESLQRWLRGKVDFNPHVLVFPPGLEPLGARLSHVHDKPAVYVGYGQPGSGPDGERLASLFVFSDPSFNPAGERHRLRRIGERQVLLVHRHGYNVVLWKESGVVYSLVSDLDERQLFSLIVAAMGN